MESLPKNDKPGAQLLRIKCGQYCLKVSIPSFDFLKKKFSKGYFHLHSSWLNIYFGPFIESWVKIFKTLNSHSFILMVSREN